MRATKVLLAAVCTAMACGGTARAAITFDANVTPDAIFGTGNPNGLFTVDQSGGVELGLRAKIPFVGTINSNGDGTYSYTLAELLTAHPSQRWNFDWTVNTDYLGSSGVKIDDLTYLLKMDYDPSQGTVFLEFDPITPGVAPLFAPFFDHSIGDNTTANGGGAEAGDAATYASLIANNNVAQQSWRHPFFTFAAPLTYDPTIDGTYDVVLSAFDSSSNLVASTSIQVIIGAGGGPACGNGIVQGTEECDDGTANNSDTTPDACRTDCTLAHCGDGVQDTGEECDVVAASAIGGVGGLPVCVNCQVLDAPLPAVSEWGLIVMALLGLTIGTILYGRRRTTSTA